MNCSLNLPLSRVFYLILFTFLSPQLFSQNLDSLLNNKRNYNATSIGETPPAKIDGLLTDTIWNLGEWQGNFTQQQPYGGRSGTEVTWIKVLYDHSNLYVAIVCNDAEPSLIRDMLDRRDAISGDMTGIAIDSYFDKRTAFEFNLSAAGQKMDLKHLGDYQWDFNWDAVWDGATSKSDSGWLAEMRIPFSQLRYAGEEEYTWGMHVWRWIERKHEEDQWQYIPKEAPAMVYLFGELKGIKNIRKSRQVEILPYVLGSAKTGIESPEDPLGYNAGINAKIGIRSDYTLDLAVNPDFGQVEADPSVLNLSSYETFYEEKRPFFLEGTDIFDFRLGEDIPYYSRRIGSMPEYIPDPAGGEIKEVPEANRIISAVKVTGKSANGLSLGLVNGLTAREYAKNTDISGNEQNLEVTPLSNNMASRMKQEFRDGNSSVGAFFSLVKRFSRDDEILEQLPDEALIGGIDALHQWKNRNYFVEVKGLVSRLKGSERAILSRQLSHNHRYQRPDADYLEVDSSATRLAGSGGLIRIGKKGGNWNYSLQGQYRSPGLNLNDLGFIAQSDYYSERTEISYEMNKPTRRIRNYSIELYQEGKWSFGGETNLNELGTEFRISNNKLWTFNVDYRYTFSHLDPRELRGGPALRNDPFFLAGFWLGSNSAKDLYGNISWYHLGSAGKEFLHTQVEMGLTWLPIRQARLSAFVNLSSQDYYQQYVTTLETILAKEYIVANLDRKTTSFTLRAELFLNPEISLQYYGNPYYSVGSYEDFRRISGAGSRNHEERFDPLSTTYDQDSRVYNFDYNGESLQFADPNFSFIQYRSNLVFRWEYHPGSTLYLVWSHDRSDWRQQFNPIEGIMDDLFGMKGNNVFMLKLNYWFSL